MQTATPQQVRLLQHTLGLSEHQRRSHRNHFVTSAGTTDYPDLEALEGLGLMARVRTPAFCDADDIVFVTTKAGADLALEHLPAPIPPEKRTQHRKWVDADASCSFGEWLCGRRLPKVEREATHEYVDGRYRCIERFRMYRLGVDSDWRRDIEGQWASAKKEAKASYKAALRARQQEQRAQAQQKGPA